MASLDMNIPYATTINSTRPSHHRYKRHTKPWQSEATELDYLKSIALTTRDAPFGTTDTPSYRPKLIGGNMVNVYERPPDNVMPRYEKINFISDKPNNMDPRAVIDFNKRYNAPYQQETPGTGQQYPINGEDPFNKRQSLLKPAYTAKRPDSKDISSRYPTLAPIDKNRYINHIASTVFEPEAWTKPYDTSGGVAPGDDVRGSYNRQQNGYSTGSPNHYDQRPYQPPSTTSSSYHDTDDQFRARLMAMIPRGVFLPEKPISLTKKDEMRLLSVLGTGLYYSDPVKLRDAYLDISNTSDKQLSGYCQYQDLFHSLSRAQFTFPPDLLQLTAAMFVSDHRNQRDVNYEKFLSFVGVALKNKSQIPPAKPTQQYYNSTKPHGKAARHRIGSPFFNDGGEAKLLRMVEEQLNENEFVIDFESLVHSFQREDREMRGTLSADQVKSICFQHRIPIQESLIMGLLHRCDDNNKDEQYNWWSFLEFLERVQPLKTGLPIPASKRPLDYAKKLPEPKPSWPKGDVNQDGPASWRDEPPDASREIISRMDEELKDLERNYEKLNRSSRQSSEAPWFKNFMQFADALYRQDEKYEGSLPYSDVAEWTKMYNNAYNLDMGSDVISSALSQSTKGGKVDIHRYLTLLGKRY